MFLKVKNLQTKKSACFKKFAGCDGLGETFQSIIYFEFRPKGSVTAGSGVCRPARGLFYYNMHLSNIGTFCFPPFSGQLSVFFATHGGCTLVTSQRVPNTAGDLLGGAGRPPRSCSALLHDLKDETSFESLLW